MVTIHTLTLGAYQTNCYIVFEGGSKSCAVIDPGYDAPAILRKIKSLGLTVDAIMLTHGHFDHVGAVEEIVKATGCALWMSESDWSQFPDPVISYLHPLANCDFTEVNFCEDGECIQAGGLRFEVLATPGHTPGSVCLLIDDAMFSGDTLFAGSIGRCDFPGSSILEMRESLQRLCSLAVNYRVFPGHGEDSTLEHEKKTNPYLR